MYFGHVQHGLHTGTRSPRVHRLSFSAPRISSTPEKLRAALPPGHAFTGIVVLGEVAAGSSTSCAASRSRIVAVSARYPGLCHSVLGNEPAALESRSSAPARPRPPALRLARRQRRPRAPRGAPRRPQAALARSASASIRATARQTQGRGPRRGSRGRHTLLAARPPRRFSHRLRRLQHPHGRRRRRANLQREGWQVPADISLASADLSPVATKARRASPPPAPAPTSSAKPPPVLSSVIPPADGLPISCSRRSLFLGESTGPARK
jgi:hypothetical protein